MPLYCFCWFFLLLKSHAFHPRSSVVAKSGFASFKLTEGKLLGSNITDRWWVQSHRSRQMNDPNLIWISFEIIGHILTKLRESFEG